MKNQKKAWTLLFLVVALVAIILLSAGISELKLLSGKRLQLELKTQDSSESRITGQGDSLETIFRVLFAFFLVFAPVAVLYLLISPKHRKRAFQKIIFLSVLFTFSCLLLYARPDLIEGVIPYLTLPPVPTAEWLSGEPATQFIPDPPQWLIFVVSLGLIASIVAVIIIISRFILRRRSSSDDPLQHLAQDALEAVEDLQAGTNLRDIVMRSYYKMACVAVEMGGIRRSSDMTPQEFAQILKDAGLPNEPLRQLTRLFEDVRYGAKVPSEKDERQAVRCLTTIAEACRSLS
jgi:NADH:ubiquinone oxidoreductase subunit 3 (subunit A)